MINKVILVGNVGRDPEIRSTQSGTQVANFTLATNERKRDPSGEWTDHTEWHRIVVWGRTVNVVEQYVNKGRQLYIEGVLRTREWERDGQKRYTTEIHARELKLLGGRGGGGGGSTGGNDYGAVGQSFPDDADDVPF